MSNEEIVRETKEVVIDGHTLKVLSYITGREQRAVQASLYETVDIDGGTGEVSNIKGSLMLVQQEKYAEIIVKEIDGSSDNVLDAILRLPAQTTAKIMLLVSNISQGKEAAVN